MSVLTDLIYGGSNAVAGLTEGAVNDAIATYGADKEIAFPDTAYFFPTIYAATGVKVKTLGDLPACVGVLGVGAVICGIWVGCLNRRVLLSVILIFAGGLCLAGVIRRIVVYRRKKERESK